ncbi:MAG: L-seryl-tRNA(Sec) selenium transferase [Candidatus Eisenbacteria bacterium]|uniref:L-seryl-tRNA(Sec) selenium transferase n=1 Tax=Eiseniibacteriota bacterium TaxID=2212470 RepID=A0A948W272_UNCEI|nr:L-seryl-tRNA(Sec) selenium transferase [Candidatus Eisenbacteria bacterium]MBU1950668.1 L-seryl-tRNA(Sec) selenium transferase [Candidatus Eisenbacteria bacterium]MBU2689632.1 L-seryl-tRNA(Sec) selenium transferase [Candidatus Eisenbacteria bacterium]
MGGTEESLRRIPGVDRILETDLISQVLARRDRGLVVAAIREVLAETREHIRQRGRQASVPSVDEMAREAALRLDKKWSGTLRHVINATGIILHTNLGRAPLGLQAQQAVHEVIAGYCSLEMDLETGRRRSRLSRVTSMLADLTQAPAAMAVNNNAAAVYTILHIFAKDRPVAISRGEQVEIGGSFRLPDIIEASGARLMEVGTTNRTRIEDYAKAIERGAALILKVHPSNYTIQGFTEDTAAADIAQITRAAGIPFVFDLGSGSLDQQPEGVRGNESSIQDMLKAGADLVTSSGDKLLGGPQAGLIFGGADLIDRIKRHPLARVVRLDKILLCALEATLATISLGAPGWSRLPLQQVMARSLEELEAMGRRLRERLMNHLDQDWSIETAVTDIAVGGGSLPGEYLPSRALKIGHPDWSAERLAACLRAATPPIIGRIVEDQLHLDLRTLLEEDLQELPEVLAGAVRKDRKG